MLTVAAFVYGVFHDGLRQGSGFRTDHRLLMTFDLGLAGYSDAKAERFFNDLLDRVRATPGVLSGTVSQNIPDWRSAPQRRDCCDCIR